jgi:hypothetical protein
MDKEDGNRKRSTEGKVATERVANGKVKGQKKRKREELLGDVKKRIRKGRRRRMHGKKCPYRQ